MDHIFVTRPSSNPSSPSSPSSSPLSSLGTTPSPPAGYPSPPCSNLSDLELPPSASQVQCGSDGPPPAKKRKISVRKPRTTERLDLRKYGESCDKAYAEHQRLQLQRLVKSLRGKRKIVVVAGAGISVSAGIPDFRSSTGLFTTLRSQNNLKTSGKELFDASVYKNDASTTSFHSMVRELAYLTEKADPTPFHHLLASLAEEGRLMRLYTQNIDGIDTGLQPLATNVPLNPKGPWPKSIQLHGGLENMVCSKCGALSRFVGTLFDGPEAPSCPACIEWDNVRTAGGLRSHGIGCLRPRMVLYNEFNPDSDAIGNVSHADLKSRPDAVVVVGTSLKVPGIRRLVRELCAVTRGRRGGFTAWINLDEPATEFKDCWDLVVRGESDEVARHVNIPRWDDKDHEMFTMVSLDGERDSLGKAFLARVEIPSTPVSEHDNSKRTEDPPKAKLSVQIQASGMPTPGSSPRPTPSKIDAFAKMKKSLGEKRKSLPSSKAKLKVKASMTNNKSASKVGKKHREGNSSVLSVKMKVAMKAEKKPNPTTPVLSKKPAVKAGKKPKEGNTSIKNAMKVTKKDSITSSSNPKRKQEHNQLKSLKQKHGPSPTHASKHMEPISPSNQRMKGEALRATSLESTDSDATIDDNSSPASESVIASQDSIALPGDFTDAPTTRPQRFLERPLYSKLGRTISPNSVPSGMHNLIE